MQRSSWPQFLSLTGLALGMAVSLIVPALAAPEASVQLNGRTLFQVAPANGLTGEARAERASRRLAQWLDEDHASASLHVEDLRRGPALMLGDETLLIATPEDAQESGGTPRHLAESWKTDIEQASSPASPGVASLPLGSSTPWDLARHLCALMAVLLGGAIAAWLVSWGAARMAERPSRYGLRVSGAAVTVAGGVLTLAISLGTLGASLAYLPIHSLPLAAAVVTLGAVALIASSELLGNLAGGMMIAWTPLFGCGDYVRIGGHAGRVEHIGLCFTRLETERHGERLVPNSAALRRGVAFTSPSSSSLLSQPVRLAYTVPRDLAQAIIVEAALRTQGLVDEPFPECFLAELEDEVVRFELRAWLAKGERAEAVKSRFHIHLLDVLAENELGPTGAPLPRTKLRIGLAPADPEFPGF